MYKGNVYIFMFCSGEKDTSNCGQAKNWSILKMEKVRSHLKSQLT